MKRFYFFAKITFALVFCCSLASAERQSVLYYILDGSGSMWGRVEGEMKIQIAKRVMSQLIMETPENVHGGLMVYGHRRKGDCSDIEELVPVGVIDKEKTKVKINGISPRGMTPITDSIQKAVSRIKAFESETTIVLVSDGLETCDKDPCATVKQLKESGSKFIMHVIGFGVKDAADKQLSCIAKAGGGRYFSSKNAQDLLSSLTEIRKSVVENKIIEPKAVSTLDTISTPKPTPEPTATPQQLSSGSKSIRIKAKGPGRVELVYDSWLKPPRYWKLVDPEKGIEKALFGESLDQQFVPVGEYQVLWRQSEHGSSEVLLSEVISVESGKITRLNLKTGIRLDLPSWIELPRYWGLKRSEENKLFARFSDLESHLVPTGIYELVWRQYEHGSSEVSLGDIEILPDVLNGIAVSTAFHIVRADWVPNEVRFWELQKVESKEVTAHFRETFKPQLVSPGKYRLFYRQSEHGASNSDLGIVTIRQGELNEFNMNTGVKLIPPKGIKNPYRIKYIEIDSSGKEIRTVSQSESFNPMPLKPGKYKIIYHQSEHGSMPITLVESFELPLGNLVEIEL